MALWQSGDSADCGDTFNIEFIKIDGDRNNTFDPRILGVARDTEGNLYKVVFGPK